MRGWRRALFLTSVRAVTVARLIAVNFLIRVAAAASGQLFVFLIADRLGDRVGVGSFMVGLLAASFFVTELVGAPIAGGIADRIGQLRVLRLGPAFGAASAALAAVVVTVSGGSPAVVVVLLGARLMEGSSAACAVPTTLVLLSRLTAGDATRRTRVMGQFEISSLIGMIAGFGVAGVGYDALGAGAFLLLPPLYGVAWWLVPRRAAAVDRAKGTPSPGRSLKRLAAMPGAVAFGVAWLAINAVVGLWLQYAPFLFKLPAGTSTQRLVGGYTGSEIGLIFGAFGLVFLTGLAAWSLWGGRLPRRASLVIALTGMLGVVATLAWVNHGAPRAVLVLTGLFVLVESGFTVVAFAHLADLTEHMDEARGAALGVYSLLLGLGQLGGSTIGAPFAATWQMDGVLLATALLALTSLVGVLAMGSRKRSPASESREA